MQLVTFTSNKNLALWIKKIFSSNREEENTSPAEVLVRKLTTMPLAQIFYLITRSVSNRYKHYLAKNIMNESRN
jgi:hypothetical protein